MTENMIVENSARRMTVKWRNQNALKLLRRELLSKGDSDSVNFLPGVEAIGAGYNPFLDYASADSITVQLFDWNAAPRKNVTFNQKYLTPDVVDVLQADSASYYNASGSSINEFQSKFGASAKISGKYNFFSGSLSSEFNEESLSVSENEFSRIQHNISLWSLRLPVTGGLAKYLKKDIADHFNSLEKSPEAARDFFDRFGSHFLVGIVMGGCSVYSSSTNKLMVDRTYSIETVAQASYDFLTGQISGEAKAKYEGSVNSFNANSISRGHTVGGNGVLAAGAFDGKEGFDKWKESVAISPDFVQFVSSLPLVGIWTLFEDQEKAAYYEEYFNNNWAPEQSHKRQYYPDYVDSLVAINGGDSNIHPPAGYTKIYYDLNTGAKGDYIYLCYHKATYRPDRVNNNCIDDVKIIYGKDAQAPSGYVKLDLDLNKGAHGEYVYLCYRPVAFDNNISIKDITVIGGKTSNVPAPYGFEQVPGDLNKGAHGNFIYVFVSKTA
ncbi:MAC/perforin domain-containing protein [Niveispirillum sp. SYP-B3756]|uniref:MAC/perforin domain-containing protein n=1 Tax=Niveispirillum sp. SYP-B3756 TaxID=2662178 RepID=UPI00156314A5|nr:MAC/perforin domain-containing protein [Niveispirillum sp. SYP-B3756]